LHAISVEIASLQELAESHGRALDYCLELTASEFGFVGLMQGSTRWMWAIKGFVPNDQSFYARFRTFRSVERFRRVVLTGHRTSRMTLPAMRCTSHTAWASTRADVPWHAARVRPSP